MNCPYLKWVNPLPWASCTVGQSKIIASSSRCKGIAVVIAFQVFICFGGQNSVYAPQPALIALNEPATLDIFHNTIPTQMLIF